VALKFIFNAPPTCYVSRRSCAIPPKTCEFVTPRQYPWSWQKRVRFSIPKVAVDESKDY